MKRFIGLLLALMLVFTVGCGATPEADGAEAKKTPEPTVEEGDIMPCDEEWERPESSPLSESDIEGIIEEFKSGEVPKLTSDEYLDLAEFFLAQNDLIVEFKALVTLAGDKADKDLDVEWIEEVRGRLDSADEWCKFLEGYEMNPSLPGLKTIADAEIVTIKSIRTYFDHIIEVGHGELLEDLAMGYIRPFVTYAEGANDYADILIKSATEPAPLDVVSIKLKYNSAGTPELYLQVKNIGEKAIDAFDFRVECFDAYGDVVKGYNAYDYYGGTYQDKTLDAGDITPKDWYWDLFGFDLAKTVRVSIEKYHTVDGDTVTIPEGALVWIDME